MSAPDGRPGFASGIRCLFGGIGWLASTPSAWPLALVPLAVGLVLGSVLAIGVVAWVPGWLGDLVGPTSGALGAVGRVALQIVGTVAAVVMALFLAMVLAQPLSGPALEALARKQEDALGAPPRPPTGFVTDVARSLSSALVGLCLGVPLIVALFVLSLIVPAAAVVLFPVKMLVAAFVIAWDLCDYPLSVRGVPIGQRIRVLAGNASAVLGFSLGLALAGLVPFLQFVLLPAGVAGATRLMLEIQRSRSA
jgi:CysZ protein